jgi:polygalacturonase
MNTRLVVAAGLLLAAFSLDAQQRVRVRDTGELVQALASNRTVLLAPGTYKVSEVVQTANPAVSWSPAFDGPELVITGLSNLTLRAEGGATLLASPRYAFTLTFVDCRNLVLEGLTLGHTEEGYCAGGVVRLDTCEKVRIQGCDLFGSGTVGVDAVECTGISLRDSTIRDCTSGAFWATRVRDLRLERTRITGNVASPLLMIDSSWVVLESCWIERNTGEWLFWIEGDSGQVALPGSLIRFNQVDNLSYESSLEPDLSLTRFEGNAFEVEEEEDYYEEGYYDEDYDENYEEEYSPDGE